MGVCSVGFFSPARRSRTPVHAGVFSLAEEVANSGRRTQHGANVPGTFQLTPVWSWRSATELTCTRSAEP